MILDFNENGGVTDLGADDATREALGSVVSVARYSHVWPWSPLDRMAFRLLNWAFGERSRVGAWTRTWAGPWTVRLAMDKDVVLFIALTRQECLDWERKTFEEAA